MADEIARHFPAPERGAAAREVQRVTEGALAVRARIAVVRLSAGDLAALARYVDAANRDPRDVLWWSEHPDAALPDREHAEALLRDFAERRPRT